MTRPAVLAVLIFAATASADVGPPARFEQEGTRVAGTTWLADDGPLGQVTYFFEPSGVLVYTYANGTQYRNGTWKQQGDQLYFEANQAYREFRAPIRSGKIVGPSWNKAGNHWTTTLTPQRR